MSSVVAWVGHFPSSRRTPRSCGYLCHGVSLAAFCAVDLQGTHQRYLGHLRISHIFIHGGFLKWGYPSYHPLIDRIFHSKASSYWGCPMTMESHGFHPHLFELTAGCAPCLCLAQAGTRPRSGFVKNRIHR